MGVNEPLLQQVREKLGPPPRRFRWRQWFYLRASPPAWVSGDAFFRQFYRRMAALRRDGAVVWGALVQANSLLFAPGADDCPASVLYSTHPWYEGQPGDLVELAGSLYDVKATAQDDPLLREFSRVLEDELDRAPGLQVPHALTDGRDVFHTSVMVIRKHLPGRLLRGSLFPLLVDPQRHLVQIVPSHYWPEALVTYWLTDRNR
jgi:hypothetical protein